MGTFQKDARRPAEMVAAKKHEKMLILNNLLTITISFGT
jgi:hypothetical protein